MRYDLALLESTRDEVIKFLKVIEDMQGGDEDDYACKKNDMRPQKFRGILAACLEQRSIAVNSTPEEKIYEALFETVSFAAYPSDLDQTIPYCMEQFLDGQEQDILRRIYWDKEAYESISAAYNTNTSRIKRIARNALKKMKNETAVKYIEFGLDYEEDLKKIRAVTTDDGRSESVLRFINNIPKEMVLTHVQAASLQKVIMLLKQLKADYTEIYGSGVVEPVNNDEIEVTVETCNTAPEPVSEMRFDGMELPNRLKNLLQKNNIITVGDLMRYSSKELQQMRGMGSSMMRVLVTELGKYGVTIS